MNTPAMEVAKRTPTIDVASDKTQFAADGKLVGMAISGGGMRASAFTLGVFAGLGEIRKDGRSALDLIDFASSNSGGSWALAALLAQRWGNPRFVPANDYKYYAGKFASLNKSGTRDWAAAMVAMIGPNLTLAHLRATRPRAFFNSSLLPSQDPFVFVPAFSRAYGIDGFHARGSKEPFGDGGDIDSLPLGYVAATSGSVPGFTHSYARTTICADNGSRPSFCNAESGDGGWLRMVDGGLYDNVAYKTLWEVARAAADGATPTRRAILLIDSKPDWAIPTAPMKKARSHDGLLKSAGALATKGSFPLQEATFRRMAGAMFDAVGYKQVILLDFDAAARIRPDEQSLLHDLPDLVTMAADEIRCVDGKASIKSKGMPALERLRARGGDCLENNFARVGYHHKTTYFYDAHYFAATFQLGVLVARRNAGAIRGALGMD